MLDQYLLGIIHLKSINYLIGILYIVYIYKIQ